MQIRVSEQALEECYFAAKRSESKLRYGDPSNLTSLSAELLTEIDLSQPAVKVVGVPRSASRSATLSTGDLVLDMIR